MRDWRNCKFLVSLVIMALVLTFVKVYFKSLQRVGHDEIVRYEPTELNLDQMRYLAGLSDLNNLRKTVQRIAVKRVVNTAEHSAVRNYIVDYLKDLKWTVQLDIFTEKVPIFGFTTFHNIVARQNPNSKKFLMLGCHYDSKYFKNFDFVAAMDSAVPCAMMLNMANNLKDQLTRSEISLMFVFFDGEEAFGEWSEKDSLYGSRHFAELWQKRGLLRSIDLFVLLDLIGAKNVTFKNNILSTSNLFHRFVQLEQQLSKAGILRSERPIFQFQPGQDVDDDHLPFIHRNVPVIHLIAAEYPEVWHTAKDVEQNVDYPTIEQVDLVLRMFVMEYLNLAPSLSI